MHGATMPAKHNTAQVFLSQVAGIIQWIGYDGVVDEDEEGQVCEEVEQVEGAKATEFTSDLFLVFLMDPSCLQLDKQLFSTDTTLWCLGNLRLALQQEQEQLLQNESTGNVTYYNVVLFNSIRSFGRIHSTLFLIQNHLNSQI